MTIVEFFRSLAVMLFSALQTLVGMVAKEIGDRMAAGLA